MWGLLEPLVGRYLRLARVFLLGTRDKLSWWVSTEYHRIFGTNEGFQMQPALCKLEAVNKFTSMVGDTPLEI